MKYFLLACLLFFPLVSCDLFKDDPTRPPALNKVYEVEFIAAPNASIMGWIAEVQYNGVPNGYMGRFNINSQDRTIGWNSEYDPSQDVQVTVYDAAQSEVAMFLINDRRVVRTRDGVAVTLNEQGWDEYSENIWHCQLDCRQ